MIASASFVDEDTLGAQDDGYEYPVGLADFTIYCDDPGDTATITIFYDQVYNTSDWVIRKFNPFTNTYSDLDAETAVVVAPHGLENGAEAGTFVTAITYSVTDGSSLDHDAATPLRDGVIVDPVGPGVVASTYG